MRAMLPWAAVVLLGAATTAAVMSHEEPKGTIENTVGPMSVPVLQARLKDQGYSNISIAKTNALRYRVEAMKNGKRVSLFVHPQTGQMIELGPDAKPVRAWRMPVEAQPTGAPKTRPAPHPSERVNPLANPKTTTTPR